jgi:hypothetical protein
MEKYYNTFVVKISNDDAGKLRGHIQHVATQEQRYFASFTNMNKFITEHLQPPSNDLADDGKRKILPTDKYAYQS